MLPRSGTFLETIEKPSGMYIRYSLMGGTNPVLSDPVPRAAVLRCDAYPLLTETLL